MARGRSSLDEPLHRGAHSVARHAPQKNRAQAPAGQWEPEGVSVLRGCSPGARGTKSYGEIAADIDRPTAVRAVARANGDNRIAILIPCHRVIGADGKLTGYGGGLWRKKRLLDSVGAGDVTLILSELSLSDLTTWRRNVAELTGIPFAGVTGVPPEERRRDRIRSRPS